MDPVPDLISVPAQAGIKHSSETVKMCGFWNPRQRAGQAQPTEASSQLPKAPDEERKCFGVCLRRRRRKKKMKSFCSSCSLHGQVGFAVKIYVQPLTVWNFYWRVKEWHLPTLELLTLCSNLVVPFPCSIVVLSLIPKIWLEFISFLKNDGELHGGKDEAAFCFQKLLLPGTERPFRLISPSI